ncbi:MAG: sigma-E factor negative regulatory protein, partial [Gammaproteobacteria bacterium]|nr:sigma-E factor negative regulatory protein [Gammaproteobacteria bacterium]
MKEFDKESLSELLDNEADDFTVRRLLKLYDENTEIAETWERYNLVQAVMHDNASLVKGSLIKRVREQVNTENQLSTLTFSHWQHAALKIVIAASVAIVSIFLVQQTFDPINSEIIL